MSNGPLPTLAAILSRYLPGDRLSLRMTAKKIGMNPGHLSRILSGRRKLCLDTALAICVALDLSERDTEELIFAAAEAEAAEKIRKLRDQIESSKILSVVVSRRIVRRIDDASDFTE